MSRRFTRSRDYVKNELAYISLYVPALLQWNVEKGAAPATSCQLSDHGS